MHHLGRLEGGREVCEHRDLLVLVPENEDRPQGARAADARRLLDDVVHLPRALEGELAPLEAVAGHEAAGFAAFQVGDKADAWACPDLVDGLALSVTSCFVYLDDPLW